LREAVFDDCWRDVADAPFRASDDFVFPPLLLAFDEDDGAPEDRPPLLLPEDLDFDPVGDFDFLPDPDWVAIRSSVVRDSRVTGTRVLPA